MRPAALILVALLSGPALAQSGPAPDCPFLAPGCDRLPRLLGEIDRDLAPLLREYGREFRLDPGRELDGRLAPLLDRLGRRMDPILRELIELMGDLTGWEAPEVLPNGDILIRRRPPGPRSRPPEADQPPSDPPSDPPAAEPPVSEPFEL